MEVSRGFAKAPLHATYKHAGQLVLQI
jgi:hypothetical protein